MKGDRETEAPGIRVEEELGLGSLFWKISKQWFLGGRRFRFRLQVLLFLPEGAWLSKWRYSLRRHINLHLYLWLGPQKSFERLQWYSHEPFAMLHPREVAICHSCTCMRVMVFLKSPFTPPHQAVSSAEARMGWDQISRQLLAVFRNAFPLTVKPHPVPALPTLKNTLHFHISPATWPQAIHKV